MSRATSYAEVTETLKKPSDKRSDLDVEFIIPWFQTFSKSFNELPEDVLRSILKDGILISVPKRVAVIIQGEIGDYFYMVLRGNVSVAVQTAQENERINLPPEMQLISLDEKISQGLYETEPLPANFNRSLFGNIFNEIGSGKFFGELALMATDGIRRASVITEDLSDLLIVKRDLYQRCLMEQQISDLKMKREFIKCFPAFTEWNDRQITNLALSLRLYQLKTGKDIVVQGEHFDGLHFIIKGQARISVEPVLHPKHFEKVFRLKQLQPKGSKQKQSLFQPRRKSEFLEAASLVEGDQKEPKNSLEQSVDSISKHCPLTLCVFDDVGIIGDVEFMLGWSAYYSTVTCTEDCQILQLDTGDCFHIFQTRSKRKMNFFLKLARDKVSVLLQRWPEPGPVRLLTIANRELNKLLAPAPDVRADSATRRKQRFGVDSAPPSLFPVISYTSGLTDTKKKDTLEDQSDSDDSVDEEFIKRYRYSVSLKKEKSKDKKKEVMFGRATTAGKTTMPSTKILKKLAKRESKALNNSQLQQLTELEYRIAVWYDELEDELNIPADRSKPKLFMAEAFTAADVCRLLDEYPNPDAK